MPLGGLWMQLHVVADGEADSWPLAPWALRLRRSNHEYAFVSRVA